VSYDAFVARINPAGNTLAYSTLLGGSNIDAGFRIAVRNECAYVTGSSQSPDFPRTVTNLTDLRVGITNLLYPNSDAFLTELDANGSNLVFSALFGGSRNDVGWGVALDPDGDAFVVGITTSTNFPVFNASGFLATTNSGGADAFVTVFTNDASQLLYSAYLGGSGDDYGYGIAVDAARNAYIVGRTLSTNFPTVYAGQASRNGTNDAFLAKIVMPPVLSSALVDGSLQVLWPAFAPEFGLESSTSSLAGGNWAPVLRPVALTNGWHTITLDATNNSQFFRLRNF
jgi:hypothetical protein